MGALAINDLINLRNQGQVIAIGIEAYEDEELTNPLTSIDWGTFIPGQTKNITCWIYNSGNTPVMVSIWVDNWNPKTASYYLSFDNDYNGTTIEPETSFPVIFTLSVSQDVRDITTFNFDIFINAY